MSPASGGPSGVDSTSAASPPAGAALPARIGTTLGRYQIVAVLGHGAMATVFRAHDPQLGRDVALKVMGMVHAARSGASERFRREAHAVAALRHPGIVEIFDFVDATESEPAYIVAELISGPTLRQLMDKASGRLLPEIAALVALPLAEALTVAHERGIVHRDVKPDNVMVESTGKSSRVVLTDFGIAHMTGMETMTATGALVGSPAYMSPEQSRGHEVGPGTDIWSLGTMLYEMVTGMVPFGGKDPYTVIAAILHGKFRPPSRIAATVGPDLEAMILRCLKTNPAERYAGTATLAADLRGFTRAAGLAPEAESLRRYLDDPEGTLRELRPRVADACVVRARQHGRRGQLARALAEIGRATAYVPDHADAAKLLGRLSAGRTALRVSVVVAALSITAGVLWLARPLLVPTGRTPSAAVAVPWPTQPTPPLSRAIPTAKPSAAPPPATAGAAPPAASASGATASPADKTTTKARAGRRIRPVVATPEPKPAESAAPSAAVPPPVPAPAPPAAAATETPEPRPGTVALFAKGGFCYPSLDDHPAGELMPVYRRVPPGRHKIFCSRTKDSAKELAGEVDVPAGARIERTVTEHAGRLTIARAR